MGTLTTYNQYFIDVLNTVISVLQIVPVGSSWCNNCRLCVHCALQKENYP